MKDCCVGFDSMKTELAVAFSSLKSIINNASSAAEGAIAAKQKYLWSIYWIFIGVFIGIGPPTEEFAFARLYSGIRPFRSNGAMIPAM